MCIKVDDAITTVFSATFEYILLHTGIWISDIIFLNPSDEMHFSFLWNETIKKNKEKAIPAYFPGSVLVLQDFEAKNSQTLEFLFHHFIDLERMRKMSLPSIKSVLRLRNSNSEL